MIILLQTIIPIITIRNQQMELDPIRNGKDGATCNSGSNA